MLEYETQAFVELLEGDGLAIMAKGLGMERLFIKTLSVYGDPGNLVVVIGTTHKEEQFFIEQLALEENVNLIPKIVTAEYSVGERNAMYMEGGIVFVTSRILVVDMLVNRIPIELITGILVYKAHRVIESGQEAFILRLFREKNKTGFIKAFSETPFAFTRGFCQVERVMRNLFVDKLHLWPRFHVTVCSSLDKVKLDVIEIHVKMTPLMEAIQMALLDLISTCIKELKSCNPTLDTDELTVENIISKSFDKIVRFQLDPIWNQLSAKTRQLIADLQLLRRVLICLTQNDAVTFYSYILSLRSSEKMFQESTWLFLESAQVLYVKAKQRVFRKPGASKTKDKINTENSWEDEKLLLPEENSKWPVLKEILKEIEDEVKNEENQIAIIILVKDEQAAAQLKEYLTDGAQVLLNRLFKKVSAMQKTAADKEATSDKEDGNKKTKKKPNSTKAAVQITKDEDIENQPKCSGNILTDLICKSIVIIHSIKNKEDPFQFVRLLQEYQPRFAIVYDADLASIRQLETYKSSFPYIDLKVYFLMYGGTVEEQSYLTCLRQEKDAFELLIKEKATMVITAEQLGKSADNPLLSRDPRPANQTVNTVDTRRGGGSMEKSAEKIVLVDMREFRSELPSLIHRRGIEVIPITLEVGDYILSNDICVERKSVSDLIGSLNNGRLYNQALAMTRHFTKPMLLIEFDQNKPFTFQGTRHHTYSSASSQDFMSKLLLLTLHFPQLRLLWCSSPYATAELFEDLKEGRPEPVLEEVIDISAKIKSSYLDGNSSLNKYNPSSEDLLMKLPGVNSKNCYSLLNNATNVENLVTFNQERLTELLGNSSSATALWESVHLPVWDLENKHPASKKPQPFFRKRKK